MSKSSFALLEEVQKLTDEEVYYKILDGSENPSIPPPEFEYLLMVAGERQLGSLSQWFEFRLECILNGIGEGWSDIVLHDIVRAATSVIPGKLERYRHCWIGLLNHRKYSTLAYGCLIRNTNECLEFLETWWKSGCNHRHARLRQILQELFDKCDRKDRGSQSNNHRTRLKELILETVPSWDSEDLKLEVINFLNHGRHL